MIWQQCPTISDSRSIKLVEATRSIRAMWYIKILSPQNSVIFQQRLTISDSRLIKLVEVTRSIRDMECIKISPLGEKIFYSFYSLSSDLAAVPNHL